MATIPVLLCSRVPWTPNSALPLWPFCWHVAIVLDHFSRKVVGFGVSDKNASATQIVEMIEQTVGCEGRAPKYAVTDQGSQFGGAFLDWCDARGVKARFGAVGKHASIAVLERLIARSMANR